jgi:uncharacterized protein
MMSEQLLIDADSHITEPANLWTSRVPARFVDRVPRVERDEEGRDVWVLNGTKIATVGSRRLCRIPPAPAPGL